METSSKKQLEMHWKILPPETKKAFDFLSAQNWLGSSGWYLAGGTALALQTGIRKSVDLDFFTTQPKFDTKNFLRNFGTYENWQVTSEEDSTIYGELLGAKVSFIAYPFFVPTQEFLEYGSIRILQKRDIAVMKIVAISQRGKKRDFFDLYWCAHHVLPLLDLLKRLPQQYPSVAHDYHHILKSLVYFDDAEVDPEPEVGFETNWETVKDFFRKEIPRVVDILL